MASFTTLPTELLIQIATALTLPTPPGAPPADKRPRIAIPLPPDSAFADLAALALTSRRAHRAANPVLYATLAARHPYTLAWAAETRNRTLLTLLLREGRMRPDTLLATRNRNLHAYHVLPRPRELAAAAAAGDPARRLYRECYLRDDHAVAEAALAAGLAPGGDGTAGWVRGEALGYVRYEQPPGAGAVPVPVPVPVQHGIVRDSAGAFDGFPMHFAAANGDADMMRVLLEHGASVDVPSLRFCRHLVWDPRRICDPAARDVVGVAQEGQPRWTPLHVALCMKQDAAFWELWEAGARRLDLMTGYDSAVHHALELGRRAVVERFFDDDIATAAGAMEKDVFGTSLFWMACHTNNVELLRRLVGLGADVDEDSGTGYTPLFDACLFAKVDLAKELLALGAAIDIPFTGPFGLNMARFEEHGLDIRGFPPLDVCVWLINPPSRQTLFKAGYWERLPGDGDLSPKELRSLEEELMKLLLDAGADIDSSIRRAAGEHKMETLDALMAHAKFKLWFEKHGLGGIVNSMVQCPACDPYRSREASSSVDPMVDYHYAELEDSLRKHGLLRQDETVDWAKVKTEVWKNLPEAATRLS